MNEDNTFKKLKGITAVEAENIFYKVYRGIIVDPDFQHLNLAAGIPAAIIREKVDNELIQYGWSYDKLMSVWSDLNGPS